MFACWGAIMIDVYEKCPVFEDSSYTLRMVATDDCLDLLKVYSDVKSVPLFNSDNCGGDDFYKIVAKFTVFSGSYGSSEINRIGVRAGILKSYFAKIIGNFRGSRSID